MNINKEMWTEVKCPKCGADAFNLVLYNTENSEILDTIKFVCGREVYWKNNVCIIPSNSDTVRCLQNVVQQLEQKENK